MHRKRRPIVVATENSNNRTTATNQSDSASVSTGPTYGSVDTIIPTTTAINTLITDDNAATISNVHSSNHNFNTPSTSASCQNLIA